MSFPDAMLTTDHFHVIKLGMEALQHIRVKYPWEEMDKENQANKEAKEKGIKYRSELLSNEDTPKQLLARCRYIIAKRIGEWTPSQQIRAQLLFERYPIIERAYKHIYQLKSNKSFGINIFAANGFINIFDKIYTGPGFPHYSNSKMFYYGMGLSCQL